MSDHTIRILHKGEPYGGQRWTVAETEQAVNAFLQLMSTLSRPGQPIN